MKKVQINSLYDFIEKIQNFKNNAFFRGESGEWSIKSGINASGYRWLMSIKKINNVSELYELRNAYYREIGYSLNEKDTENFISYCQHHGLPTELLDITENPLIALYFAAQKSSEHDANGYIYLFDKNRTISTDNLFNNKNITKQKFDLQKNVDIILNSFLYNRQIQYDPSFELLPKISPPTKLIFDNIVENYQVILESLKISDDHKYYPISLPEEILTKKFWQWIKTSDFDRLKEEIEYLISVKTFGTPVPNLSISDSFRLFLFCVAFKTYIEPIGEKEYKVFHGDSDNYLKDMQTLYKSLNFIKLKYIIHKPSVKFDRMVNQSGLFLYQLVFRRNNKTVHQILKPNMIFEIPSTDKEEILNQLDMIGINQKFIFHDNDNIAEYFKDNWKKIELTNNIF